MQIIMRWFRSDGQKGVDGSDIFCVKWFRKAERKLWGTHCPIIKLINLINNSTCVITQWEWQHWEKWYTGQKRQIPTLRQVNGHKEQAPLWLHEVLIPHHVKHKTYKNDQKKMATLLPPHRNNGLLCKMLWCIHRQRTHKGSLKIVGFQSFSQGGRQLSLSQSSRTFKLHGVLWTSCCCYKLQNNSGTPTGWPKPV